MGVSEPQYGDAEGQNHRKESAKRPVELMYPCPATGASTAPEPRYVLDHVVSLKRGGRDAPSNMQWQTEAAANAGDKV